MTIYSAGMSSSGGATSTVDDVEKARRTVESFMEGPAPWGQPVLVMLSGLPGTGKSYFGRRLAERIPMAVVSTDAVRLALVCRPTYTWQESHRIYEVCHKLVEDLLEKSVPTIFDATNLIERYREVVYQIAERHGAKLIVVETVAPPEVVLARMQRRAVQEDKLDRSEADWAVYLKMKETADAIRREHFTVDTSKDVEPALDEIVGAIRD